MFNFPSSQPAPRYNIDGWQSDNGEFASLADARVAKAKQPQAPAAQDFTQQQRQRVEDLTLGRSNEMMADPRIGAALDYFQNQVSDKSAYDPAKYAQATDLNAAHAGTSAEQLRSQMASAGIGMNDPAAQAQMRRIETGRQTENNAALREAQQSAQGTRDNAAATMAQMRLQQWNSANQPWMAGVNAIASYQNNQGHTPTGLQPQVKPLDKGKENADNSSWQPPMVEGGGNADQAFLDALNQSKARNAMMEMYNSFPGFSSQGGPGAGAPAQEMAGGNSAYSDRFQPNPTYQDSAWSQDPMEIDQSALGYDVNQSAWQDPALQQPNPEDFMFDWSYLNGEGY